MELFYLFSGLISLAAIFSFINVKFFNKPNGIAMMVFGTIVSVIVLITASLSPEITNLIKYEISLIDFSEFVLGMLLSFLLFAGSLNTNWYSLKKSFKSVFSFATMGVILSTIIIGFLTHLILLLFGLEIPILYCLIFGALISPTDPIAVMSILNKSGISDDIKVNITGESLFNDGVGVVIFIALLQISKEGIENLTFTDISLLFVQEAIGGILLGFVIGYIGYLLMKSIDNFQSEILITLMMVMGGYSIAHNLHLSGPLAMVVAGLFTGNKSKAKAWSHTTTEYLEKFWEVVDEILNSILFILIGLEIIIISFNYNMVFVGLIVAILLILSRLATLWSTSKIFMFAKHLPKNSLGIMTLGGLRGGISIALALSLPNNEFKAIIVSITYVIVLFSIIAQGYGIEKYLNYLQRRQ